MGFNSGVMKTLLFGVVMVVNIVILLLHKMLHTQTCLNFEIQKSGNIHLNKNHSPSSFEMSKGHAQRDSDTESRFKNNYSCVRIVVPFIFRQSSLIKGYISRLTDWPACRLTNSTCIHIHFMLDAPKLKARNVASVSTMISSQLNELETTKKIQCVEKYSFSVFDGGNQSYHMGSYVALKYLVMDSHFKGYSCMALMELDVSPIAPNWLDELSKKCFFEGEFLIKGTAFTDISQSDPSYGHINGNCLWHVSNWKLIDQSFTAFQDFTFLLTSLPVGYDVLFRHVFIRPIYEPFAESSGLVRGKATTATENSEGLSEKWRAAVIHVHQHFNHPELNDAWSKGYNRTEYILNSISKLRPPCLSLTSEKRIELYQNNSRSLLIHCSTNERCIRIIVYFTFDQLRELKIFLSWFSDGSNQPCCRRSQKTCVHLQFLLKNPSHHVTEETLVGVSNMLEMVFKHKKHHCIKHYAVSVSKHQDESPMIGHYQSMKNMIFESYDLGFKYVFFMGLNVQPLQQCWINHLHRRLFFPKPFLGIKGSAFNTIHEEDPAFGHINENCLWHIEDIDFLRQTFKIMDQFSFLLKKFSTTHDILFRHIFIRPVNEKMMESKMHFTWATELNKVYAVFGNNPITQRWSQPMMYDKKQIILLPLKDARPSCSTNNSRIIENVTDSSKHCLFVLCDY